MAAIAISWAQAARRLRTLGVLEARARLSSKRFRARGVGWLGGKAQGAVALGRKLAPDEALLAMAIQFVKAWTTQDASSSTTSVSITTDSSLSAGDLMLALVCLGAYGTGMTSSSFTAPSGWTVLSSAYPLKTESSANPWGVWAIYWKIATSGDIGATVTFSWSGVSTYPSLAVVAYSGTTTNPIDATNYNLYTKNTSSLVAPSINASAATDLLVCFYSTVEQSATYTDSYTLPSALSQRVNFSTKYQFFGGSAPGIAIGDLQLNAAGATQSQTCAVSGNSNDTGCAIAITLLAYQAGPTYSISAAFAQANVVGSGGSSLAGAALAQRASEAAFESADVSGACAWQLQLLGSPAATLLGGPSQAASVTSGASAASALSTAQSSSASGAPAMASSVGGTIADNLALSSTGTGLLEGSPAAQAGVQSGAGTVAYSAAATSAGISDFAEPVASAQLLSSLTLEFVEQASAALGIAPQEVAAFGGAAASAQAFALLERVGAGASVLETSAIELSMALAASCAMEAQVAALASAVFELIGALSSQVESIAIARIALVPSLDGSFSAALAGSYLAAGPQAGATAAPLLAGANQNASALGADIQNAIACQVAIAPSMTTFESLIASLLCALALSGALGDEESASAFAALLAQYGLVSAPVSEAIQITVALILEAPLARNLVIATPMAKSCALSAPIAHAVVLTAPLCRAIVVTNEPPFGP